MKASRLCFAFALVFAACTSVGCSDDDDDTAQTPADTGLVADTGQPDTGTTTDTGTPADTGTPMDTGTPADTAVADTAGDTAATTHTVTVGSSAGANTFTPSSLTIKVGDKVRWTWAGPGHTVTEATNATACTAKSGGFDSGLLSTGATFEQTFTTAGTVNYICTPHCLAGMRGTITVTP